MADAVASDADPGSEALPDPKGNRWSPIARDRAAILGAALPALLIYGLTACRTVYVGDSGELATVAATFGLAHPSGYPGYTLIGGLFTHLLGFLKPAFAANLFSGVCGAGAVAVLVALLLDWIPDRPGRRPAAVGAGLLLAFATAFWQEATVARVYAPNALASLAVLRCASRWAATGATRWAVATGLVTGLALSNHLAAVGAVAAALVLVGGRAWAQGRAAWWRAEGRVALVAAACVLPGLALYLWLPLRWSAGPPEAHWDAIESFGDLVSYVLRTRYAQRSWTQGDPIRMAQVLGHGLWVVAWDFKLLGAAVALWGFRTLRGHRSRWLALAAFALVFALLFALHGQRRDLFLWDRYWIPWHALAAIGFGLGFAALAERCAAAPARWAAAVVLPCVLCGWHWTRCDRSGARRAEEFALKILEHLPEKAQLIVEGDDNVAFPLLYFFAAERRRPDAERYFHGMWPQLTRFSKSRIRQGRYFWSHSHHFPPGFDLQDQPWGLIVFIRTPDMRRPPPAPWAPWRIESFESAPPPEEVYESHERELLAHYFSMKAYTYAGYPGGGVPGGAGSPRAIAEAALRRAHAYAHGNEFSLGQLWRMCRHLGFREVQNAVFEELRQINPDEARSYAQQG